MPLWKRVTGRLFGCFIVPGLVAGLGLFPPTGSAAAADKSECVILVHGLARSSRSMNTMEAAIRERGYHTVNLNYPSTEQTVQQLAQQSLPTAIQGCRSTGSSSIHFVTHSMGGILVRYYLSIRDLPELRRVVMLSPPNRGSEVVDSLKDSRLYQWFNGPAGQQLGTDAATSLPLKLDAVSYPVGIITGNESSVFDHWFSEILPGEDDGKVSVERSKVPGMTDFLVLPYTHTFIMNKPDVIYQTINFLEHGKFDHSPASLP